MKKREKLSVLPIAGGIALLSLIFLYAYNRLFRLPNYNVDGKGGVWVYVYPGSTWKSVTDTISVSMKASHSFDLYLYSLTRSATSPMVGAYLIGRNSTTRQVYNLLFYGLQSPVALTIGSVRQSGSMWKNVSRQVMSDSLSIARAMTDTTMLQKLGISDSTALYHILPKTYEVCWSISPNDLVAQLVNEYSRFWSAHRQKQAQSLNLTPRQVVVLASIVQEESNKVDEYPMIAGLYLNRLERGMPLQADPTVKYALQDFSIRRLLKTHLSVDSPYNTYRIKGLPPGPIRVPTQEAIDGVLNATSHRYLYMCAKHDFSGYHTFAESYNEHLKNAALYQRELNDRNIH